MALSVREIGEQGLLQRLFAFCPPQMVGDDAAILTIAPSHSLVVTTDVLVDGVHFSDRTTPPESVGWRSAAANLSDLAAMGAIPLGITVGLALPGEVPVVWVERLYRGLTQCLQCYHAVIVGGDVVRSPVITVAITALGQVTPDRVLRRSTAQPGDAIVVTGYHGASRAGLELLLHPKWGKALPADDRRWLIQAHQRPRPRLDVLPLLEDLRLSQVEWLSHRSIAAMDSSDGLADAVGQICRASGVGAQLQRSQLPIPPVLQQWLTPQQAVDWALYGGEDFELVLCLPAIAATSLVNQLGAGAACIGSITADPTVWLMEQDHPVGQLTLEQGFQHFSDG